MNITNIQQENILGIVVGLFDAAPGQQFLSDFTTAFEEGLTEEPFANSLAAHPVFTNQIMGGKNTTAAQVVELMDHFGLTSDGVSGSAASQAKTFFTSRIDSNTEFGAIIVEAGTYLLGGSVAEEFTETANVLKNKITVADIYSASQSSTDLVTLQSPLVGLNGKTVMTRSEATTFLQNGGFIPNSNSATITEGINGPLTQPTEFDDVSDTFILNLVSANGGVANGGGFDVGADIVITLEDANGSLAGGNAETFTLNATINDGNADAIADGINTQIVTVAGVENLKISSKVASLDGANPNTAAAAHTLMANLVAADAKKITLTGDSGIDLSPVTTIGDVNNIDASGLTGNLKINFSGHGQSVSYIGSDGNDTYWGGTAGDVIKTGTGHDLINLEGAQAAQDTLVLEVRSDSKISDTNNDGKVTILEDHGFDELENFSVGAANTDDRVDISSFNFTGTQQGIVDVSDIVPSFDTDITNISDFFSSAGGDRGLAFSVIPLPPELPFPPQTMVFIDINKDGDFVAADDMMIELMSVGPLTGVEIFIF